MSKIKHTRIYGSNHCVCLRIVDSLRDWSTPVRMHKSLQSKYMSAVISCDNPASLDPMPTHHRCDRTHDMCHATKSNSEICFRKKRYPLSDNNYSMAENLKHAGRSKVSDYDQHNHVYGIGCISTKELNGFYADVARRGAGRVPFLTSLPLISAWII